VSIAIHPIDFIFDHKTRFSERMMRVFEYQYGKLGAYQTFCAALGTGRTELQAGAMPPLLPVEAFRESTICTLPADPSMLRFESSGTTGMRRSVHYIPYPEIYRQSVFRGIGLFYPFDEFIILAYTPGYQDNPHSSLIWMLQQFINNDASGLSRFLELGEPLPSSALHAARAAGRRVMLFGAAFGLIDLAEAFPVSLPQDAVIIETGGMKTHRREMGRDELHRTLTDAFGLPLAQVHSEYGMTELLSQAYADGTGWFRCPHWMRVSIRDAENPMEEMPHGEEGLIGIIDLANYYSCSFLLTGDKGVQQADGSFQVLGRYIPENLRGCNFLIDQE